MTDLPVLIQLPGNRPKAFSRFAQSQERNLSPDKIDDRYKDLGALGIEIKENTPVIPMFDNLERELNLAQSQDDIHSTSTIISGYWDQSSLSAYNNDQSDIKIWHNSPLSLHDGDADNPDEGPSIADIREALNLDMSTALGRDIRVGIIDGGISHDDYPVENNGQTIAGGTSAGSANVVAHGSMCAAAVGICAPNALLYDYPVFAQRADSETLLTVLTHILEQKHFGDTPLDVLSNSYSYDQAPGDLGQNRHHEVINFDHPVNEKFREIVHSDCIVVFSAGNCGDVGALGNCSPNGIGSGKSIHGPNSLPEVITVGAADINRQRLGYSSQGPGWFEELKPDFIAYSRYHGNYGPGRPGFSEFGTHLDEGTSAAAPLLAGLVAMLMSESLFSLKPNDVYDILLAGASGGNGLHDTDEGFGLIDAAASLSALSSHFSMF